jgi:chemosensory pili system protein ChpA (sensor histidine kinase/response regulator)
VRTDGQPLAVVVDAKDGTRERVIRPLDALLSGHPLISGTSLSATGEVIFALSAAGLARWIRAGASGVAAGRADDAPRALPVLVVDDSISVRKAAVRQLRALGHEVEEASDGLEALSRIRTTSYGLVLSDLEMPRMDGFELLGELGRLSILAGVPVLVASTRSDPETRRRVLGLGASGFLAKPIDPDVLAARVQALIRAPAPAAVGRVEG